MSNDLNKAGLETAMNSPLDEKGLDAAEAALMRSPDGSEDKELPERLYRRLAEDAIRAYLSATVLPDGLDASLKALANVMEGRELRNFSTPSAVLLIRQAQSALAAMRVEIDRLRGLTPELPPYPPEGEGLPRFGLRWNGPEQPLAVPMDDGYWTPYHLASLYRRHCNAADSELSEVSKAIGSVRWMDPPDGGDVSLGEQVNRMRCDLDAAESKVQRLTEENEDLAEIAAKYRVVCDDRVKLTARIKALEDQVEQAFKDGVEYATIVDVPNTPSGREAAWQISRARATLNSREKAE